MDLYRALEHVGALRRWLLDYKISDDLDANARAPESPYRAEMISLSKSDVQSAFHEALDESTRSEFCDSFVESALVYDDLKAKGIEKPPQGQSLNKFLAREGYTMLEPRITIFGKTRAYWTKIPERFPPWNGKKSRRELILEWLDNDNI